MAPLSHDLAGIILPHDIYGSHLDENGNSIDVDLEEKNFYAAAEVLSEVWSKTVIDKHNVDCKAVVKGSVLIPEEPTAEWLSKHVLQSRYCLRIVKCLDVNCCEPFETNWNIIFPKRFMPSPAVYKFGLKGLEVVEPSEYFENQGQFKFAILNERLLTQMMSKEAEKRQNGVPRPPPFDTYCPSMQTKIDDCVCKKCCLAWPCAAANKRHQKAHICKKFPNENIMVLLLNRIIIKKCHLHPFIAKKG